MRMKQSDILRHLHHRIQNGESSYSILQINDKYYENKILKGYCQISSILFHRIMSDTLSKEERADTLANSDIPIIKI